MNAIFTWFLIFTNHVAHGLFNLHLIPVVTLWLPFWTLNRILRPSPSSSRSLRFFHKTWPWMNLSLMTLKPGWHEPARAILGNPHFFRVLYPFTLLPLWLKSLDLRKKTRILAAAALIYFLLIIYSDPNQGIDVYFSNNLGIDYLKQGLNPYSQSYPDSMASSYGYRPGFLYWPGTLYLEALSRFLFGDLRVILALLWWIAPFLFPESENEGEGLSLKAAWWFLPFLNFCIRSAWVDPILAFCAALVVYSLRNRRLLLAAFAIALAASVKQYGGLLGVFAIPYVFLIGERKVETVKLIVRSGLIFAMLLLPFLVWDFHSFVDMTLLSHLEAKTRLDALNFTAWWITLTGIDFPARAQGIMTLSGFALALWHLVRNAKSTGLRVLPEAWAIAFGFSVVFGKFGFANYYWLWISFLLLALALEKPAKTSDESGS
ncbi:MAG: hypothetical protein EBX52_07390 [Proteobacteria bacterium]|nr:hypothetical protein [Pseudomonadota bacterium]